MAGQGRAYIHALLRPEQDFGLGFGGVVQKLIALGAAREADKIADERQAMASQQGAYAHVLSKPHGELGSGFAGAARKLTALEAAAEADKIAYLEAARTAKEAAEPAPEAASMSSSSRVAGKEGPQGAPEPITNKSEATLEEVMESIPSLPGDTGSGERWITGLMSYGVAPDDIRDMYSQLSASLHEGSSGTAPSDMDVNDQDAKRTAPVKTTSKDHASERPAIADDSRDNAADNPLAAEATSGNAPTDNGPKDDYTDAEREAAEALILLASVSRPPNAEW